MNTFDLIRGYSQEAGWNDASQIVLLCDFLDQLQENIRAAGGADILIDLERYLEKELDQEQDDTIIFTGTAPETIEFLNSDEIPDLDSQLYAHDPADIYRGGNLYAVGDTPNPDELDEDETNSQDDDLSDVKLPDLSGLSPTTLNAMADWLQSRHPDTPRWLAEDQAQDLLNDKPEEKESDGD